MDEHELDSLAASADSRGFHPWRVPGAAPNGGGDLRASEGSAL